LTSFNISSSLSFMSMASTLRQETANSEFCPTVSVVIPIYNGAADLPELLECLMAQTYPRNQVEYLLVDNGSRDRTPALLQAAVQAFASQGLSLRDLRETQIQSSYAARNVGIQAASGEILAFTDADCRPQPQWLQALVHPFQEQAIGMVAGEIVALPGQTLLEQHADRQDTLSQKHTLAHPFCPYGQTANLAVRRLALAQVGLFRPYLTTGGDADLCWRVQQQGHWQLHYAEEATVQHRHRTSIGALRRQWQRYGCSNLYLHELHGIQLTRELTRRDYAHRLGRWLLKELPLAAVKVGTRQAAWVELLHTPLDLLCVQARASGQRTAQLPDQARQIEWLADLSMPQMQSKDS
jgi:glycosyltransferase involved in cell wall biosynthesis